MKLHRIDTPEEDQIRNYNLVFEDQIEAGRFITGAPKHEQLNVNGSPNRARVPVASIDPGVPGASVPGPGMDDYNVYVPGMENSRD